MSSFDGPPLKDRAQGRWTSILPACGLGTNYLRNKHGPCPMCGGKDRFRFDDKGGNGTWICNQCGAGDGIELVKRFNACDFPTAARMIEAEIGEAPVRTSRGAQAKADGPTSDALRKTWARAKAIATDDPAGTYLRTRCGLTEFPSSLRFSADEHYSEPGQPRVWLPCLVAKVDPSESAAAIGDKAALHRTYLTPAGEKANVKSPRKMLGSMPRGAAVRLMPPTDTLGIAEGIETALSAAAIYNVPCWAALTAGLLQEWTPPENVQHVFIFGDNDASFTGQSAAFTLAMRLRTKGLDVLVEMPPRVGDDWNDVHKQKLEAT